MVTGGGGGGAGTGGRRVGGDGKTLGDGGLSPYLIPFLSTPPRSPDSGGPTLCTGGGGRRAAAANAAFPPRPPSPAPAAAATGGLGALPAGCGGGGAGWAVAGLRAARLGSAGGGRGERGNGHYLKLCYSLAAFRPSLCLSACLPARVDLLPAAWQLILLVNFALFGLSALGD